MSKIKDGGPAFPTTKPLDGWGDPNKGMSLRDWYAGMALQGMLASGDAPIASETDENGLTDYNKGLGDIGINGYAEKSWMLADAMLKARGQ